MPRRNGLAGGPTARRRDARGARLRAVTALVLLVAVVACLVVFVASNPGAVLLGLLAAGLFVCGVWWHVSKRGAPSRWGLVAEGVGAAGIVAAILYVGAQDGILALRVATVVALAVVALALARSAVTRAGAGPGTPAPVRRSRPTAPVLLCNPRSGGGKVERFDLVSLASSMGVRVVVFDGSVELVQLARRAVEDGADCLGMAGGDGSQALVASIAAAHGLPFVCVPAGTRNHFALDLGLDRDDPRKALAAYRDGVERVVDLATVNGRTFVNNVSLGVYAMVVQEDEYRDAKAATTRRVLPEVLDHGAEGIDLRFSLPGGAEVTDSIFVLVSNNPYVLRASRDAGTRHRLDAGTLGVAAVSASSGPQAAMALASAISGRRATRGHAVQFETTSFEVTARSGHVPAGVDGEAMDLTAPVRFESRPGALRLLVPEGNPAEAARRAARGWTLADLAATVTGSTSGSST